MHIVFVMLVTMHHAKHVFHYEHMTSALISESVFAFENVMRL